MPKANLNSPLALIFVILVAAAVRLSLVSSAHFVGDEALFYHVISQIRDGAAFPLLGPPVTGGAGKHPGPLFFYLMSLSQWISRSPEAANAEVAILGAISVGFLWDTVRIAFDPFSAIIASLMMACAPWSILLSDRIWNSNVVTVFVGVALWAAAHVHKKPGSRWIALFVVTCAVLPQLHLSAPIAWLGLIIIILPSFRNWNWKWIGVGLLITVIFYLPYLDFEFHSGFANLQALRAENGNLSGERFSYKVIFYAFRFFTLDTSYFELNGSWGGLNEWVSFKAALLGTQARPFHAWSLIAFLSSLVLSGWIYLEAFRQRKFLGVYWTALWIAVAADIFLLTLTPKRFFPHYLTTILPFFFVIIAAFAQKIRAEPRILKRAIPLIAVFCVVGVQASIEVSKNSDAKNGLGVERQVIEHLWQDQAKEAWPAGTKVGLKLGFPGFVAGYPELLKDIYHSSFTVAETSPSGPQYELGDQTTQAPTEDPSRIYKLDRDELTLYRLR